MSRLAWARMCGTLVRVTGLVPLVLLAVLTLECAHPAPRAWVHPTPFQWQLAQARLDRLRADAPRLPYAASVTTVLRDAHSGRVIDGRGAIAVAPDRGIRMILIGGAGTTLLDAWVTPQQFRIAVPPLALIRRGGSEAPRELPVAFLRWWFFGRLNGGLMSAQALPDGWLWLLRAGDAVAELRLGACGARQRLRAVRIEGGRTERVDECRSDAAQAPGDSVRYVDESSGFEVELSVDAISAGPPSPEAFLDPDTVSDAARSGP